MADVGILILRIAVGIVMVAHGLPKIFWKRELFNKKWKKEYGFPLGSVLLTGIVQVVGGLAIIVGVFTQLSALILSLNILVATYVSIWKHQEPFLSTPDGKGWDVNFLLVATLIALIFLGSGAWSLVGG
ncbi:MAG: DoxX family protein [Anaerolineales bacterium]|nr:DoxX family protein [Anaerolineales bacterium]MCK5430229.1 DoxX family protein [Anaerolineales bacterium]